MVCFLFQPVKSGLLPPHTPDVYVQIAPSFESQLYSPIAQKGEGEGKENTSGKTSHLCVPYAGVTNQIFGAVLDWATWYQSIIVLCSVQVR